MTFGHFVNRTTGAYSVVDLPVHNPDPDNVPIPSRPEPGIAYAISNLDVGNGDGTFGTWVQDSSQLLAKIRAERDTRLTACDYTQMPDTPITASSKADFATYRQQLRDFPATCDPLNPVWPVEPAYVKA